MRNRLLIVLCACFLVSSAAWADDMGYIDCSAHPQGAQVLPQAGKTSEVVANLSCGERFTILQSGLYFTQVKTKDGKVGFVYSYLISRDKPASSATPAASAAAPAPASNLPSPHGTFLPPKSAAPVSTPPAPAQTVAAPPQPSAVPAQAPTPAATSSVAAPSAPTIESKPAAPISPPPAPVQPPPTPTPSPTAPAPAAASNATPPSAPAVESKPIAPVSPPPAPAQTAPAPTPTPAPTAPAPAAAPSVAAPGLTVVESQPPAPAPPPPAPAQPPVFHPRSKNTGPVFEPPFPRVRTEPLIEIYGGYAYARLVSGGNSTNVIAGVLGSFGWNLKPWLQVVGDSSYSTVTVSGAKTVLYGNHFGPRVFLRRAQSGWGMSPFVEALFGGTRADTTTGSLKTSNQSFSIKAGGGLDMHPSRHIEIRMINVDYYRTSFPGTSSQNNYWASAGIVFRFLGGRPH